MPILSFLFLTCLFPSLPSGVDSDSDSDLSMEEERSLSIPSSESDDNVRLRGRIQRRFKRSNHGERLLTEPANNDTKGRQGFPQNNDSNASKNLTSNPYEIKDFRKCLISKDRQKFVIL